MAARGSSAPKPGSEQVMSARAWPPGRVQVKPEPGEHAGPEVLDHDVGGGGEAACRGQFTRLLQVQDHPALAPVEERVRGACAARAAGRVDVDDVRPLVGEQHGGQRAGHVLPEVDDPQAGQRAGQSVDLVDDRSSFAGG